MSSTREYLSEALAAILDGYDIIPWDSNFTPTTKTVMFYRSGVAHTPEAPNGSWTHTITLYVVTPKQLGAAALDDLDAALDDVLLAIEQVPGAEWSAASYKVLNETLPTFEVTASVLSKIAPTQE